MIEQFRRFLSSPAGKVFGIVATLALLYWAFGSIKGFFHGDTPESALAPTFIDAENGKTFQYKVKLGDDVPVLSPFSGHNSGYPAEPCCWTKDGTVKAEPTWVLLNSSIGKTDPTFCPDCGRLVVVHNPPAEAGKTPPPTREQWFARHQRAY